MSDKKPPEETHSFTATHTIDFNNLSKKCQSMLKDFVQGDKTYFILEESNNVVWDVSFESKK